MSFRSLKHARSAGALSLLVLLAAAPGADAATRVVRPDGLSTAKYDRWVATSKMPTPDVTVELSFGPCRSAHAGACTRLTDPPKVILTPGRTRGRTTFLHELGHVFDRYSMGAPPDRAGRELLTGYRRHFLRLAKLSPERPWLSPPNSPSEKFAEAYAHCALDPEDPWVVDEPVYEWFPSFKTHARVCRLIRRAGGAV